MIYRDIIFYIFRGREYQSLQFRKTALTASDGSVEAFLFEVLE